MDMNPEPSCCEAKVATLIFGHPFSFLAFQREEQQHLQMPALEGGCGHMILHWSLPFLVLFCFHSLTPLGLVYGLLG